jgi:hypothetical protein
LSAAQEAIVLIRRQSLYLPLDDLLFITKAVHQPRMSPAPVSPVFSSEGMARVSEGRGLNDRTEKTFQGLEQGRKLIRSIFNTAGLFAILDVCSVTMDHLANHLATSQAISTHALGSRN